jgi:hypothetical protein
MVERAVEVFDRPFLDDAPEVHHGNRWLSERTRLRSWEMNR